MTTHKITCNPDGSFNPSLKNLISKISKRDTVQFISESECKVSVTPTESTKRGPALFSPAPVDNTIKVPAGATGVTLTVADDSAGHEYSIVQLGSPSEGGSGAVRVNT